MTANSREVRDFLTSRRAKVTPEQVELPGGSNRRVPGLRRNEVAMLAGVSVEYYSKVERGNLHGVSDSVLHAIADALLLDTAERAHLLDLSKAANASPVRRRKRGTATVRPSMQLAIDSITSGPAFIRNGRLDVLAENALFRAMYSDLYALPQRPVNLARFTFIHEELSRNFYPNWSQSADINVGILRTEAGRDPDDADLQALIGELSTCSVEFRTRWGAHNVRHHASGNKYFVHPVVGDLHMTYEAFEPMGEPGLNFLIYSAEPGSPTDDALKILASWAAPRDAAAAEPTDRPSPPVEHTTKEQ
jgi:transcriptional regulator with XRE-family HTH domain